MKTQKQSIISEAIASIPEENTLFITHLGNISDRVEALLYEKGWTQKDLALKMDKRESEISKWLNTPHNLTIKSIAKLEAALGEEIIRVIGESTFYKARGRKWTTLRLAPSSNEEPVKYETRHIEYTDEPLAKVMYG